MADKRKSKKVQGALLGYLIIFAAVALLFEKIGWGWLWAILVVVIIGVIVKVFSSHPSKVPAGEFDRSKKPEKRGSSRTYRDYGREAVADPHYNDVIKGTRLVCTLDERTCLRCLELDGTDTPPKLPIHEGCRCVTVPVTKTWKELGIDHEEFKEVPEGGGIYRDYLIERAKAMEKGIEGEALARHLRTILPSLKRRYPKEVGSFARIKAKVSLLQPSDDLAELEDILRNLTWPSDEFGPLFKRCAEFEKFSLIDNTLRGVLKQVPAGPYAARHMGMLYRVAGDSVKTVTLEKAVEYYERAEKTDKENTAIMVELGKLYRRSKRLDEAKRMFERVLAIKRNHKEARREIAKL